MKENSIIMASKKFDSYLREIKPNGIFVVSSRHHFYIKVLFRGRCRYAKIYSVVFYPFTKKVDVLELQKQSIKCNEDGWRYVLGCGRILYINDFKPCDLYETV